jgi:hypothetical protein
MSRPSGWDSAGRFLNLFDIVVCGDGGRVCTGKEAFYFDKGS